MRLLIFGISLLTLLSGCAGTPPPPQIPQDTVRYGIEAIKANPQSARLPGTDQAMAEQLLRHYSQQPLYKNEAARLLQNQYQYDTSMRSPDRRQLMQVYRNPNQSYGMVAWSMGSQTVASSLRLRDSQLGELYVLLLRPGRLCFATGAGQPPYWLNGWQYDRQQPGNFSCNGLTNRSAFIAGSQLPGKLGEYFEDGDLVLIFRTTQERDETAASLLTLFPDLRLMP